jgi:hypothetical protein
MAESALSTEREHQILDQLHPATADTLISDGREVKHQAGGILGGVGAGGDGFHGLGAASVGACERRRLSRYVNGPQLGGRQWTLAGDRSVRVRRRAASGGGVQGDAVAEGFEFGDEAAGFPAGSRRRVK